MALADFARPASPSLNIGMIFQSQLPRDRMSCFGAVPPCGFAAIFKPLGFHYVTLDVEGYRQGAMNEVLNLRA